MDLEKFKCDIRDIFENANYNRNARVCLQEWRFSCREYRSQLAANIRENLFREKDYDEKKSIKNKKASELQNEINRVQFDIDAIIQQQKIVDKKILNITMLQKNLKDELENVKAQRDNLLLKIVDLNEEHEQKKKEKLLKWDALKRACKIYKLNLNMHLDLKEEQDNQHVKISFFKYDKLAEEYFAQLLFSNGQWSVEQIEPKLKKKHFNQLVSVAMDSSDQSKIFEITLFLCELRSIFLKYYMKKETVNHSADK